MSTMYRWNWERIPSREIYDIISRNIHMKRIIRKKQQQYRAEPRVGRKNQKTISAHSIQISMETRIMFSDLFVLLEYNTNLALGWKNILVLLRWTWASWFMHKYMKPSIGRNFHIAQPDLTACPWSRRRSGSTPVTLQEILWRWGGYSSAFSVTAKYCIAKCIAALGSYIFPKLPDVPNA